MKLFDDYEAVRFPEENLILITRSSYIYYIYDPENDYWKKYQNAGYDRITVKNYPDVSEEELKAAMHGIFPKTSTDFLRVCSPSQLNAWDLLFILKEDYPGYLSDYRVYDATDQFVSAVDFCWKSYLSVKNLFDNGVKLQLDNEQILAQVKELIRKILGRDISKNEIKIVDGHDSSSYFWIKPVRVVDFADSNDWDNVAEMKSVEISIEENDVYIFLYPFLIKHFDKELKANQRRIDYYTADASGNERPVFVSGFEWYLTDNFYTPDAVAAMIADIQDTMDALSSGRENEFAEKLKEKSGFDIGVDLIIDFYRRFIYRMKYMLTVGQENGYNLISFMGP